VSSYQQFKDNDSKEEFLKQREKTLNKNEPSFNGHLAMVIQRIKRSKVPAEELETQRTIIESLQALMSGTDEAAKQDFILDFLKVAGRIYRYSWYNTMLIYMHMKRIGIKLEDAGGKVRWQDLGRRVKEQAEGADILAPKFKSSTIKKDKLQKILDILSGYLVAFREKDNLKNFDNIKTLNGYIKSKSKDRYTVLPYIYQKSQKMNSVSEIITHVKKKITKGSDVFESAILLGFVAATVYDISQTEEFTGEELEKYKSKTGNNSPYRPIPKESWMGDNDNEYVEEEDREKVDQCVDALVDFAKKKKITVNFEDTGSAGGYSAIGKIIISKEAKGLPLMKTLIHELAHEMMHTKKKRIHARQEGNLGWFGLEVDAEAVAFSVMYQIGFSTESSFNYLALVAAESHGMKSKNAEEDVKKIKQLIYEALLKNFTPILKASIEISKCLDAVYFKNKSAFAKFNLSKIGQRKRRRFRLNTPQEAAEIAERMLEYFRYLSKKRKK
jgi:predicted SprT family Zn-dependent metalloprotease